MPKARNQQSKLVAQPAAPTKMPEYKFQENNTGSVEITEGAGVNKGNKLDLSDVVLNLG